LGKLNLDQGKIAQGRKLAATIVEQVRRHIDTHTTVSVERAVLRLLGIDGVDEAGVPLVNVVVDGLGREGVLDKGAMYWVVNGMLNLNLTAQQIAEDVARSGVKLTELPQGKTEDVQALATVLAESALSKIRFLRKEREQLGQELGRGREPL